LPTASQIKQFLVQVIVPPAAGALAVWLLGTHVLDVFHPTLGQVTYYVSQALTFAIVTGLTWLTNHHILTGSYKADTPPVAPL
jgi:hypothetical protein